MTKSTIARRNFIAGLAFAAPAAAVARPAAAISAVEPDAELLALGRKLDAIIQRYEVACDLCRPLWDEHDRLRDEWFKAHRGFETKS